MEEQEDEERTRGPGRRMDENDEVEEELRDEAYEGVERGKRCIAESFRSNPTRVAADCSTTNSVVRERTCTMHPRTTCIVSHFQFLLIIECKFR